MQYLPYSLIDSSKPRDLWSWLAETAEQAGTDFVAVAHNMNLSQGTMFPLFDENGDPVNGEYADLRARWEPVEEVTQYKGDSETHAKLSPADPFADFETYEHVLDPSATEAPEPEMGDYARSGLMRGLQVDAAIGKNPFKFGMIGATDSHTAFSSAEENNFLGKYALDSIPKNKSKTTVPGAVGWDAAAQGLAGVWSNANTRDAITAAFKRKEVYATTGPRIRLRFFGGYDFAPGHAEAPDLAAVGYRYGVPMGGDLAQPREGKVPTFLIQAAKDPKSANLDRLQVVKGWLNVDGSVQERVYDVALSDRRTDGAQPVGNTVHLSTASYSNDIGDEKLVAVWTDPDFAPGLRAFYYVRVLEIPTPRHSVFDAVALGIDPAKTNKPTNIQERAYSSPIWYTPDSAHLATVSIGNLWAQASATIEELLADGSVQMTGEEIRGLVGAKLRLRNVVSGQAFEGQLLEGGKRVLTPLEEGNAVTAQALLHGGASVMMGTAGHEIVGDTIVSTDGLRTIEATLYRKGARILAARDVDGGRARFEVTTE